MRNVGTVTVYSLEVEVEALDVGLVVEPERLFLGTLGPEGTATPQIPFGVPADLAPGYYRIRVTLQGSSTSDHIRETQDVTITVRSPAALVVRSLSPDHLAPGLGTDINITVANVGPAVLSNVVVRWSSAGNVVFPLGGSNEFQIPAVAPRSEVQVPVRMTSSSSAVPGPYALTFQATYNDPTGFGFDTTSTVGVLVAGSLGLSVGVQDIDEETVTLAVANIGLQPVTGVQVRMISEKGITVTNADTIALGNLPAGAFSTAAFDVRSQGDGGPVALIELAYTDSFGTRHEQSTVIPLQNLAAGPRLGTGGIVALSVGGVLLLELLIVGPILIGRRRARARKIGAKEEATMSELDALDAEDLHLLAQGPAPSPSTAQGARTRPERPRTKQPSSPAPRPGSKPPEQPRTAEARRDRRK